MIEQLIHIDEQIFHWINGVWTHEWLDFIMPYWREKTTWIPAYTLLLAWVIWQWRGKAILFVLWTLLLIAAADGISHRLIKKNVQRLRPCKTEYLQEEVRSLVPCGSGYSFTSNHATNHFALAVFWSLSLFPARRWIKILLVAWASTIAYGQVYVGVHFPLDVLSGALLGSVIGWLIHRGLQRSLTFFDRPTKPIA
ncbi:MAG: phosphatase PAP2 family protein [Bacteroidota bacterium]